jgi:hypothetical protein
VEGGKARETAGPRKLALLPKRQAFCRSITCCRSCGTPTYKRRDAMATAAAPYLHPKISAIDAKLDGASEKSDEVSVTVRFIEPPRYIDDDEEGRA